MGGQPLFQPVCGVNLERVQFETEMKRFAFAVLMTCLTAAIGCRDASKSDHHDHAHAPPHGGTPVVVAEHKYNLELVRDGTTGLMQAYVLDEDFHDFIRVPETNFALLANFSGRTERVEFHRGTNSASPLPSDPSFLFEARAEWLKTATNFDGLIPSITLKGRTFTNISFPFPKGTQHTH
jgi:hypothetical protein